MGTDEETIWVISGISLQDALRPIKARTIEIESSSAEEEEEDGHCSTPTKKEARIAERLMCPPAPKKPKPALMCHLDGVEFFSPPDLDSVFIRRAASAK